MTLNQFLSYGLVPGKKYIVRLRDSRKRQRDFTLFFKGFRIFADQHVATCPSDIIPVFCEMTPSGKMSRKHFVSESTDLDHIVYIMTPEEGTFYKPITREEVQTLRLASQNYSHRAAHEVLDILHEMMHIFPNFDQTVVPLNPIRPVQAVWGNNDENHSVILAIGKDFASKAPYFIAEDRNGKRVKVFFHDAHIEDNLQLLSALLAAIEDPYYDPDGKETPFIAFRSNEKGGYVPAVRHEDIPSAKEKKTPVLHFLDTIDILKANLWFDSLPEDVQKKSLGEWFGTTAVPTGTNHDRWTVNDRNIRLIIYHSCQEEKH